MLARAVVSRVENSLHFARIVTCGVLFAVFLTKALKVHVFQSNIDLKVIIVPDAAGTHCVQTAFGRVGTVKFPFVITRGFRGRVIGCFTHGIRLRILGGVDAGRCRSSVKGKFAL